MKQYVELVKHILKNGTRKENRTGIDTISTFGYYYEHDLRDGFPLLTTKEVSWKNIVVELLWFLSGDPTIDFLKRHNCKFWDAWVEERTVPSAYGNFWRHFPVHQHPWSPGVTNVCCPPLNWNDQIKWAVEELKRNPMSRRVVVSAWAPGNAQKSKLPPCHAMFVCNVQNEAVEAEQDASLGPLPTGRKRLCLHFTQRSCDTALGVPYNIASYALLDMLIARFTELEPGIIGHTLVDAHVYTSKPDGSKAEFDHVPGLKKQCEREPRKLPTVEISDSIRTLDDVERLVRDDVSTEEVMKNFRLEGYTPHPKINFKVAV